MTEHELVQYYCKERALHRPTTNYKDLLRYLLQLACITFIVSIIFQMTLKELCWNIKFQHSSFYIYAICFLLRLKKFMIMSIEIYQHYAPEHIRRKCICKPTCSEYAIICIRKYNIIKALIKIHRRLTKECVGQVYHIDEP